MIVSWREQGNGRVHMAVFMTGRSCVPQLPRSAISITAAAPCSVSD